MNYEQGIGFTEFTDEWPFPEACGGTLRIVDDNNNTHALVLDYKDGCFYDISVRDGYTGSNIINTFKDKIATDGTGGTDIPTEVQFKEDTGEYEKFITEHTSSHFYLRPFKETYRSTSGYDTNGFPSGITFTAKIFVDGEPTTESATANDISKIGEIIFDRHVEGRRLQTSLLSDMSGFRLIGRQQEYITKDINYEPDTRKTTENNSQSTLNSNLSRWLTRGENPLICRIADVAVVRATQTYVTGPDSKSGSAFYIPAGETFGIPVTDIVTSSTLSFWCSGTAVVQNNGTPVSVTQVTSNATWNLYRATFTPNTTININATTNINLFDVRIYSGTVTDFDYYIDDVEENDANNVCPLF